jgi:hypothetical protein
VNDYGVPTQPRWGDRQRPIGSQRWTAGRDTLSNWTKNFNHLPVNRRFFVNTLGRF